MLGVGSASAVESTLQFAVMPNNRQLLCLIEGTRQPFEMPFSPKSSGRSLRIEIFELKCRELAPGHSNLTLLKVSNPLVVFHSAHCLMALIPLRSMSTLMTLRPPYRYYDLIHTTRVSKNCLFRRRYIQYGTDNHLLTRSTSL
jgi:hypothetical protein